MVPRAHRRARDVRRGRSSWTRRAGSTSSTSHAELALYRDEIIETVRVPGHRSPDPRPGRERYYRIELGPSRWLFAVVNFNETPARIVTAYGNRKDPPGWTTQ